MTNNIPEKNYTGEKRKVGFELEFSGIPIEQITKIIRKVLGGKISFDNKTVAHVKETKLGDFKVELDALPIRQLAEHQKEIEAKDSDNLTDVVSNRVSKTITDIGELVVPMEIVTPPIYRNDICRLDELCEKLREEGAKSTKDRFYYAFGMHINPEILSDDAEYILKCIQSFLLLEQWLIKEHEVDITRRITSFVDPFPKQYKELVIDKSYKPDLKQLIKDYHKHNPTRNRAFDMTPLFAYLDEGLTRKLYGTDEKINKRPTFHYRLPNCELSNPQWSISKEWKTWEKVEKLALDDNLINSVIDKWVIKNEKPISIDAFWLKEIKEQIERL